MKREDIELIEQRIDALAQTSARRVLVRTEQGWHTHSRSALKPLEVVHEVGDPIHLGTKLVGNAEIWTHPYSSWICAAGEEPGEELYCFNEQNHHYVVQKIEKKPTKICAINASQELFCLGSNSQGTISPSEHLIADVSYYDSFHKIELDGVLKVSVAKTHTCAIDTQGELWCWGQNPFGEIGAPSTSVRQVMMP